MNEHEIGFSGDDEDSDSRFEQLRKERNSVVADVSVELESLSKEISNPNRKSIKARTNLVDLHVARLKVSLRRDSELLLDLGLVEVGLDPSHLLVAQWTVLSISVALLPHVVGVATGGLDRSSNSPAGESSSDAAKSIRAAQKSSILCPAKE